MLHAQPVLRQQVVRPRWLSPYLRTSLRAQRPLCIVLLLDCCALCICCAVVCRMFIEGAPVAVLGMLVVVHILMFSWKCVPLVLEFSALPCCCEQCPLVVCSADVHGGVVLELALLSW